MPNSEVPADDIPVNGTDLATTGYPANATGMPTSVEKRRPSFFYSGINPNLRTMDWSTGITIAVVVVVFIILFMIFKWVLRLLVVAAFLFIAYITNPSPENHVLAVEEKSEREGFGFRPNNIHVDDYYVFSLTRVVRGDESRVIGAGAFTQVFIFSRP